MARTQQKRTRPHKCPPLTPILEDAIRMYHSRKWTDKAIVTKLLESYIDQEKYSLSVQSYKKMRRSLGLESTREQDHTVESAHEIIVAARARHANSGISDLINFIRVESGGKIRIPKAVMSEWMHLHEPDKVRARKGKITVKKPITCAGIDETWCMDQHDKEKKYGLWLHICLDMFSGLILWCKVWWTNSNPRLICGYYLDACMAAESPRIPLLTQSDPGTENFGVANAQSTLRQMLDPSLSGTMQHIHSYKHGNIKPEIAWSQLRRRLSGDLKPLLERGLIDGLYDPGVNIEMLIFRYVFIPLVQAELDSYVTLVNTTRKRANRLSHLPHGAPLDIYESPEQYGGQNFCVLVPPEAIAHVRKIYADPSDSVFQLVPPDFAIHIQHIYTKLGAVPVTRENAWSIYESIVVSFEQVELGLLIQEQILSQGQLFQQLLVYSDQGRRRADVWGYNTPLIAPIQPNNLDPDVGLNNMDDLRDALDGEFPALEQVHFSDEDEGDGLANAPIDW